MRKVGKLNPNRGKFAPLPARPENTLLRAGFTSKAEVAAAIKSGNFVCDQRRVWIRQSPDQPYRQLSKCGLVNYRMIAEWAGVAPVSRSVHKRRQLRDCSPEHLLMRADALRKAAALLRSNPPENESGKNEEEIVAESLIYQASLLDGPLRPSRSGKPTPA